MPDDLEAAVGRLYAAFMSARLGDSVGFCDHCVDPAQVEDLRVTPLRQLTPRQLGPLLFNAINTWGDVTYFTHFLPRLLELVAAGEMENWSYSVFLPGPLAQCRESATEDQRDAIADFLRAWWTAAISREDCPCLPRDVLEVIDGCGLAVEPFLDTWSTTPGETAARQLADFVTDWALGSAGSDRLTAAIDHWFRSDAPSILLRQRPEPACTLEITEAIDCLALYRASPKVSRFHPLG
ncbi:hypothetical protein [Paractinoplanes toevensis]|uniref:Uncharacterized protein n=1 Tax=Paractinoplanes toevensis TaxID=571911 RepID=A0A919WDB5_9ACTN|nr:hypothetical protein [Actinoplanes toevensis]GIM98167.1 hypothetical protein Ato02nite_099600 [Actinoplanes toevensis]